MSANTIGSQNESAAEIDQSEDTILQVSDLTKRFGGLTAVDDLSFQVFEQEILGLIGPNGAGKTTVFNCITGEYEPTSGNILFQGHDVTGYPTHELVKLGMNRTFQKFAPLKDRTVIENVELALAPDKVFTFNRPGGELKHRAVEICERSGLAPDGEKMPDELPHGGMIRLELARAIATKPDLLLIDEAFAGLSHSEVTEIATLLESLRQNGMTLIVVDHNMRGLFDLIDRALVIQFGTKIAEGPPESIKKDQTVRDAYLGEEEQ